MIAEHLLRARDYAGHWKWHQPGLVTHRIGGSVGEHGMRISRIRWWVIDTLSSRCLHPGGCDSRRGSGEGQGLGENKGISSGGVAGSCLCVVLYWFFFIQSAVNIIPICPDEETEAQHLSL